MSARFVPAYLDLARTGELTRRVESALGHLHRCDLCGNRCGVNRHETVSGTVCGIGVEASVSSYGPHLGEEDPLRGWRGSGTIFFSRCNLRCVFCQNWEISQAGEGQPRKPQEIAAMMLELQELGCHNINLVSPSHVVAAVLAAIDLAVRQGLRLPIVYNTGGYDSLESLHLLDGVIDIYMPDAKYGDSVVARRYSGVPNYAEVNRAAIREMHRQVGDLLLDENGVAQRGLLVRHLVLPGGLAGSEQVLSFLAREVSPNTYLNVMDQYHPSHRAWQHPPLDRPLSAGEYRRVVKMAADYGLRRLDERRRHLVWSDERAG